MKTLTLHDLKPEDRLSLDFASAFKLQSLDTRLTSLLQAFEEHTDGWMPDVVKSKRYRKYSRAAVLKAFEEKDDGRVKTIGLYRTKWPALDMALSLWFPPLPPSLEVFVNVKPLSFFAEAVRCHCLVEMVRAWAAQSPVTHAKAHSADDLILADAPSYGRDDETRRRDGFDKIYEVFWLNVFGPKLVETVGRERMLSTPAHRVEELPNGSILLVLWPTAAEFASPEARLVQARAHAHLRPDLDFDTLLRTLHARSATLAPVEPHFVPDLAPLLSRVVDRVGSHERSRRITELNAWRPPAPDEWLPAHAALPSDVESPERTLEHYATLAEHLVALLHSEVPSVFSATPESLTDADFYFWREDFPKSRLREVLDAHGVPAIGAYLGEVLVRHLGGRWLPRQRLEESQVLMGARVWLPFLRARRYMASRQSLLDFSLTQLYREAERHRG